tara:strand:+ start:106 stop:912 length:807 start_codon:yes stop_codon:yes gene_type:complete
MAGPTFSPDGNWMWDGNEWIPAPPKTDVLPSSAINQNQIQSVAASSGVIPSQLNSVAPYFDQNRDGILQQNELQQAAMSISTPPVSSAPQQQPMMYQQQPVVQQQPMMHQQPVIISPQIVMQQNESKTPVMGIIGCLGMLISLAFPYIGDFISGYEILEIIKEIMDDGYEWIVGDFESLGDMEFSPLTIGLFMFFLFPLWTLLISVPSLLGAGSEKAVKHMKSSGTLHLIYSTVMVICCFIVFEDLLTDIFGIGVWISIGCGVLMLLD